MTAAPYLRITGLSKRFGRFTALRDIDLDIAEGELVCFLGPSGCGKSTLLRVITGLERHDAGRILRGGEDISDLPAARRGFGILFQSYALFPNLTVADNVAFGLRGQPRATVRARVAELLDLVGLPGSAAKYPAQMSGGQQQRVALARALAPAPRLLLLDEPLSALDAKVRLHLRQQIRALQHRLGLTTIMVTHDQEEALAMADRIVVMNHGVIEQVGTPDEIYSRPASLFVADFVGRMNFMPDGPSTRAIRPEDVVVAPAGQGDWPATVEDIELLGPSCRVGLAVAGLAGAPIAADLPAAAARALGLAPGSTVSVTLPAERIKVFAGVPDAGA